MPLLAALAGVIRWFEELVALLSGPLLTIGLAIALVDLLTGGDLLRAIPALLFTWAACQAVGIDSQLVATFDKLRRALRERRWWAVFGLLSLGVMLGYVGFLSAEAFGFQHAFGVTEAQALARLGIDPISWQLQRAVLAVFLVALSGFTRYHAPAKDYSARAADEAERLRHEIALAPLRAQANAAKLRGVRTAVAAGLGREEQATHTGTKPAQPAYAVAATLPSMSQEEHHLPPVAAQKAMHDWDISDEVEGDTDLYSTMAIPSISRPLVDSTPLAGDDDESWADSGPLDGMRDLDDENDDGDIAEYPSYSKHQNKKSKTAVGRKNQRQYKAQRAVEVQGARERKRVINTATDAILSQMAETGENLSSYQITDRVNEYLDRMGSTVRTSRTAVRTRMEEWLAQQRQRSGGILSRNPASATSHDLADLAEAAW